MLEKIAPTLLAGVPCIVKPATEGAELTHAVVKDILASSILAEGALQLICGQTYDLFEHLKPSRYSNVYRFCIHWTKITRNSAFKSLFNSIYHGSRFC
jgi:hypothetical protein